jgi:hypothetical protein
MTRLAKVCWAAKVVGAMALVALLSGLGSVQHVAAQDDTIVLTAGGSTLTVTPGGDVSAVGAVAEAHAAPGYARVKAAAAEAIADCEDGALTRAAAALAVAHPDEGALTESAVNEIVASNQKDDKPIRKVVEKRCHEEKKEEKKAPPEEEVVEAPPVEIVETLPDTGVGSGSQNLLTSLFAAASAAAALGAVSFRQRGVVSHMQGIAPAFVADRLAD